MDRLRGVDIVGIIFAALCVLETGLGLGLQPTYRRMFTDFGAALPLVTVLLLQPWTLALLGLTPAVMVAEGVLRRRSEPAQVARCVVAMLAAIGLVVAFIVAMYAPIFVMTGQVE